MAHHRKKDKLEHSIRYYWLIRSELVLIGGTAMKGKRINNSFLVAETNPAAVTQQLHGYREDEAISI